MLRKFIIERELPGIGTQQPEALCAAAQHSNNVLDSIGTGIQWVHSYVANDKTYCVYLARDEALIRRHAEESGFPANKIIEIRSMLDPTMAPA
jgi:hypothetical protein